MTLRLTAITFISLLLFACSDRDMQATIDNGPLQVRDRIVKEDSPLAQNYHLKVKPILENRCVVCHGCYDAPCQLKLSSPEGIDRGFSPDQVFATRFHEADPMRLFIDAKTTQQWRNKGYTNVLNERDQTPQANLEQSVLFQLLSLKESHPLPNSETLSNKDFDFSLNRSQTCPDMNSIEKYKQEQPLAGMPYGLPNLENSEFQTLKEWLEQGAPMAQPTSPTPSINTRVKKWETLLNQQDKKSKLISRYLYEHLFLGHLYFSEETISAEEPPVFFTLVRSLTPPGEPIDEIASRRPYDDPNVDTFYYRLRHFTASIVNKTHMPYALNQQRLIRWNALFYDAVFSVNELPGYSNGSNPFKNFVAIPVKSRHQFLLDEAEYTILGFIKGPVCRGNTALGVIQDKFWVFFTNPKNLQSEDYGHFLYQQADNLELPSDYSASHLALSSWLKYAKREKSYRAAREKALNESLDAEKHINIDLLWSGDNNASLTVFRHSDSAQVVKGLQGAAPKTAWVINYPALERIHYLLVAGYDVFGSIQHQLITRLYMDFLRTESELSFITLLPEEQRRSEINHWYQGAHKDLKEYFEDSDFFFTQKNSLIYETDDAKKELFTNLKQRYQTAQKYNLDVYGEHLAGLNHLPNLAVQQLAPVSFIIVENDLANDDNANNESNTELYSLLRHNERTNVSTLLKEKKTRVPTLDQAELFKGLQSSYPQIIFKINQQQKEAFVQQLQQVETAQQYSEFLKQFAVRRTHPDFWKTSDLLHKAYQKQQPIQYGLFDYNRLENR